MQIFKFTPFIFSQKPACAATLRLGLQILKLAWDYKTNIFDDVAFENGFYERMKALVQGAHPYFWAISDNEGEFCGFVYLYYVMKIKGKPYSACVTACLKRKFWGRRAHVAGKEFLQMCAGLGFERLKAQTFSHNNCATGILRRLGFEVEGILRKEALAGGKMRDVIMWAGVCESA